MLDIDKISKTFFPNTVNEKRRWSTSTCTLPTATS